MNKPDVTFIVIASGDKYIDLSHKLLDSIAIYVKGSFEVLVFTDQPESYDKYDDLLDIKRIKIGHLEWPEATLLRYQLIAESQHLISGAMSIYIDADALFTGNFESKEILTGKSNLFFVQHPGFYRRGFLRRIYYLIFASPWENRSVYECSVILTKRKRYVFGALWGGKTGELLSMVLELAEKTNIDLLKSLYPKSYDESYLNWYFATRGKFTLLSPTYAYVQKFPWITKSIHSPIVTFDEKSEDIVEYKNSKDKRT